jgi:hypothetical protein
MTAIAKKRREQKVYVKPVVPPKVKGIRFRPRPRASLAIATDVVNIIGSTLQGMALTYDGAAFNIDDRKTPAVPQEPNPLNPTNLNLPEFVISIGEERDYKDATAGTPSQPGFRFVNYPCAVTVVTATGNLLAFDNALASICEQIRYTLTLHSTWYPNLAEFNEVNAYGQVPFNAAMLERTLNYHIITFTVQTLEPRA